MSTLKVNDIKSVDGTPFDFSGFEVTSSTGTQTNAAALDDRWISKYTTDELSTATSLRAGNKVRTPGYYAAGDGGGNEFIVEERDGSAEDGGSIIFIAGTTLQVKGLFPGKIWEEQFGVKPDGVTDALTAIMAAWSYGAANSKIVYAGPGTRLIKDAPNEPLAIQVESNTHVIGSGIGKTIYKIGNSVNSHVINIYQKENVILEHMTVDGNRQNNTASAHCIRLESNTVSEPCKNIHIRSVKATSAAGYGIGLNNIQDSSIEDSFIDDTGRDGLNLHQSNNENYRITISNTVASNFGVITAGQVGFDLRGESVELFSCRAIDYGDVNSAVGFRFRVLDSGNGEKGGDYSSMTGCTARPYSGAVNNTPGFIINGEKSQITNCRAISCSNGFRIEGSGNQLSNCVSYQAKGDGIWVRAVAGKSAEQTQMVNCISQESVGNGFLIQEPNCALSNCIATLNGENGIRLVSGGITVSGGVVMDNTGFPISSTQTSNHVSGVVGFTTENFSQSSEFSVATTGIKTVTIPHGLPITPSKINIQATLRRGLNVSDYQIGFLRISGVDATDVTVQVEVLVASANAEATCRVNVHSKIYFGA